MVLPTLKPLSLPQTRLSFQLVYSKHSANSTCQKLTFLLSPKGEKTIYPNSLFFTQGKNLYIIGVSSSCRHAYPGSAQICSAPPPRYFVQAPSLLATDLDLFSGCEVLFLIFLTLISPDKRVLLTAPREGFLKHHLMVSFHCLTSARVLHHPRDEAQGLLCGMPLLSALASIAPIPHPPV